VERRPLLPHHDLRPAGVVQLLTNAEVSGCAMVHHAPASRRSAGAELRSRTGLPILLRDSQSPVARNLSRPLVAAQNLACSGWNLSS
jgi:hypothetical protein